MGRDERCANAGALFRMDGIAAGVKSPPRSVIGRIFGTIAKQSVLGEKPIRRSMPTEKSLIRLGDNDFAAEQRRLIDWVDRFSAGGPEHCTTHPHSFFGPTTPLEWAVLGYKHLDHHLREFSASLEYRSRARCACQGASRSALRCHRSETVTQSQPYRPAVSISGPVVRRQGRDTEKHLTKGDSNEKAHDQ
jgi:Protein of unknown function (DUF1569)